MDSHYTYKLARKCLECKTPIGDQVHAARKFCTREVMPDGSVKSCKDRFHSSKRKNENAPYKQVLKHHKLMGQNIKELVKHKGANVSLEDIQRYGVILQQSVEYGYNENGSFSCIFIGFKITTTDYKQFKIENHENKF